MLIINLRTNHFENPVGYNVSPLTFSWNVEEARGTKTVEARVQIAEDITFKTVVWDSGSRDNIDSKSFMPPFTPKPETRYYWKVFITDDVGESATSDPAYFETAPEKIKGKWITAPFEKCSHGIYRRTFELSSEEDIKKARLYISGLGLYEVYLNGEKIGNEFLAPFYNDYNYWIQYQTYDITNMLKVGINELRVMLGNGWYKGRFGFIDNLDRLYGDRQIMICQLTVDFKNGNQISISSDENFECQKSPILESSIYDGEVYDANLEPIEEKWMPAILADDEMQKLSEKLAPRYSLPLIIHEELKPKDIINTPAGEVVLDFGQNITGLFYFTCNEPKGTHIKLQMGEILQNGNFYNENLRTAKEEFVYISNGNICKVRPHFTFYGFRYMKVEGIKNIELADITATALYSNMKETGHIETSNQKVNRLFLNALWGQKGNFLDVPTDCPQRDERMGWTGDAQVFSATASFNMYTPAFYRKYLHDMCYEQKSLRGAVPHVVPDILDQINVVLRDTQRAKELGIQTSKENNGSGVAHADKGEDVKSEELSHGDVNEGTEEVEMAAGSCAWGDAATIIPWTIYNFFGDRALLEEQYQNMKLWVDYIRMIDETKCGSGYLWTHGFHYGDWLALDNFHKDTCIGATDVYYVASCFYLYSAELTAKAAAILNKNNDFKHYTDLANRVRKALCQEYFTETGRLALDTQTALVLALKFNVVPDKFKERTIATLKRKLDEENIHHTTGFVGTPYLCPVLSDNGLAEYAYTLLLNEDYPSWLYEVNMGATTIWERWNSVLPDGSISDTGMNSLNHYAYGSIVEWVYRYMCGINPSEENAGFKEFMIKPYVDNRFEYANAEYYSVYGLIKSGWKKVKNGWKFNITVPFDTKALFIIEDRLTGAVSVEAKGENEIIEKRLGERREAVLYPGSYEIIVKDF